MVEMMAIMQLHRGPLAKLQGAGLAHLSKQTQVLGQHWKSYVQRTSCQQYLQIDNTRVQYRHGDQRDNTAPPGDSDAVSTRAGAGATGASVQSLLDTSQSQVCNASSVSHNPYTAIALTTAGGNNCGSHHRFSGSCLASSATCWAARAQTAAVGCRSAACTAPGYQGCRRRADAAITAQAHIIWEVRPLLPKLGCLASQDIAGNLLFLNCMCLLDCRQKLAFLLRCRLATADVQLEHASISRQHALLCFRPNGTAVLMDLDSAHGTFVGSERLAKVPQSNY